MGGEGRKIEQKAGGCARNSGIEKNEEERAVIKAVNEAGHENGETEK